MRIIYLYLTIISLLFSGRSFSQTGIIEGIIHDGETRIPLAGASINITQERKGDYADQFGQFRIPGVIPGNYEIIASYIGYKTEVVQVEVIENKTSSVSVTLLRSSLNLPEINISGKKSPSFNTIGAVDIMLRPVNSSQDMLRIIPGLLTAQHAGGGKAEQIFLRGFDIDHGTDIAITADGIPVNMVSHAHGQGYADLHFLIPELVEKIDFDKGPYFASKGNLATAGYADFRTREFLKENNLKLEAGSFNTQRILGMFRLLNNETGKKKEQVFTAAEYSRSDGYFENPQNFSRFNFMTRYNIIFNKKNQLTVTATAFDSKWNASGQIPLRSVSDGTISRFGAIDEDEGGQTSRYNFSLLFRRKLKNNWESENQIYLSRYYFNLYSNFTFFLNDSTNGDEIQQRENRMMAGYNSRFSKTGTLGNKKFRSELGATIRMDEVKGSELSRTAGRTFLYPLQKGDISELNMAVYLNQEMEISNRFSVIGGIRADYFRFGYRDILANETDFRKQDRSILSPKLTINYTPSSAVTVFLSNGIGFHSNDSRVILNSEATHILPRTSGTDLGVLLKPTRNLLVKAVLWHFYSEQEFVYVGDEGIVEPGGESRRWGADLSVRQQIGKWFFADVDLNVARARIVNEPKGENYIPLAPTFSGIGGLTAKFKNGFSAAFRFRYLDDRPADELNISRAQGYFLSDLLLEYKWKSFVLTLSAENLFNQTWNEAQFNTLSRLQQEQNPVEEIHFTPGAPRQIKAGIQFRF